MIYMDYNATTPCDERVVEAMLPYLSKEFGNPSSIYKLGKNSRDAIEKARENVAKLLDCNPEEIFFTSCGTEADNWAIIGTAFGNKDKGRHIITSSIEHHAVLNACKFLEKMGYEVTYLPVDRYGIVDIDVLKKSIKKDTVLVTIMAANNEIGTIQPIQEIAEIVRENGIYFHTDGVQVVGKIPVSVKKLDVDMLSFSGHKFYGPKGIGALYVRNGIKLNPFIYGGGQEKSKRAGTENVSGIVGLGKAAEIAIKEMEEEGSKVKELRDELEKRIKEKIPDIIINGHPQKRLYNTINLCVKYIEGESIILHLDFEGICASSGSACTSGSLEPSHVLIALGLPTEIALGSVRFSLGKHNTKEDIEKVINVLPGVVEKLRHMSPFWNQLEKEG